MAVNSHSNRRLSKLDQMIKEKLRKKRIPARLVAIVVMTIGFVFVSSGLLSQSDSSTLVVIDNELPQSVRGNGRTLESDKPLPTPVANVEMDFVAVAKETGTDKVQGYSVLPGCLENRDKCTRAYTEREACRPWGHFYDTIYQRHLGKYSRADSEPMQFLEIGYFKGNGFEAYTNFLKPNKQAELHSMEISCLEPGPREEGKWPWGNFGEKHPMYRGLLESQRLHCGDASDYDFLYQTWTQYMKRPDAPPLKVVVDDGSHLAKHMAASLFFWLPRIEPGGMLVIEDIQPISEANQFRTHILPQVMKDLHWCGIDPEYKENHRDGVEDTRCFPTIQPLLAGVHCEMHICVFFRNDQPSREASKEESLTPETAFTNAQKCLFGPH